MTWPGCVRSASGSGKAPIFTIDANGAHATADEAVAAIEQLLPFDLALAEQPTPRDRIGLLAEVRRRVPVPILADEAVFTPGHLEEALDRDAFDILSIYPGKNGGFSHSLAMARRVQQAGKVCAIGSNLETDLGQAAMVCLASSLSAFPVERLCLRPAGGPVLRAVERVAADGLSRRPGPAPDRPRVRRRAPVRPWRMTTMTNVRDFGAVGDGRTDDTEAIRHAVDQGGGHLILPRGTYRLTGPIEIDLDRSGPIGLDGQGGTARLLMDGPGPAIRLVGTHAGSALPSSFEARVWQRQRMPTVSDLEIVGNHDQADGIRLEGTMQATIAGVSIRRCRYGVHLVRRNRNVLLADSHIYDGRGPAIGVYFDGVNLHQAIICGCHISYCKHAGIKVARSEVRNLQITGCDIEYNHDTVEPRIGRRLDRRPRGDGPRGHDRLEHDPGQGQPARLERPHRGAAARRFRRRGPVDDHGQHPPGSAGQPLAPVLPGRRRHGQLVRDRPTSGRSSWSTAGTSSSARTPSTITRTTRATGSTASASSARPGSISRTSSWRVAARAAPTRAAPSRSWTRARS